MSISNLCVRADIKNVFQQMRIPGWLQAVFGAARCSHHEVVKMSEQKRLAPRFFDIPLLQQHFAVVYFWPIFFCQDVTDQRALAGGAVLLFFICRDHTTPPLLGSRHGMGSLGFRWSYADNFWVVARGANLTNVHLARLIAGVEKARHDVHEVSLAGGCADVLGYVVSPANSHCSNEIARTRSVARTVSSRRRICGRAMEFVNGHESFLALSNRGALPILDASFKFARASYLVSREAMGLVNRTHGTENIRENYMSFSAVIGVCAGLMFAPVRKRVCVRDS